MKTKTDTSRNQNPAAGFSFVELITVVIIIGIAAAFAIPNYTKSVERQARKKAETDLKVIITAQNLHQTQTCLYVGQSLPLGIADLSELNSELGLNLTEGDFRYECIVPPLPPAETCSTAVLCRAALSGKYTLSMVLDANGESGPNCSPSSACP